MYIETSVPPDCRSARNNLYSGISLVSQVRSLISLPCSVSLCFWSFLVSLFPRFLVSAFPRFRVSSFPRFPFRIPFRFPFRFPFRIPFRSLFCFTYRILFHDPRISTDSRFGRRFRFPFRSPFPVPVLVPVSGSHSGSRSRPHSRSSRQRFSLLLVSLLRGVALYRRQCLIMDSHTARPREVRSFGSRPHPITLCCVSG